MQRFEGQVKHILALLLLMIPTCYFALTAGMLGGQWLGISTQTWFWIAILVPILHQLGVMLLWRLELHDQTMTRYLGDRAFPVFQAFFFPGLAARPTSIMALAIADRNSLQGHTVFLTVIALLMLPFLLYLFYSIHQYFGIARAAGADHFYLAYRTKPLVNEGIYRYIPNAMYVVGFFALWVPALLLASRAALVAVAFQHAYIWVHYHFTEKPDMRLIYGGTPDPPSSHD